MKQKKISSNTVKEVIIKCLIVFGAVVLVGGIALCIIFGDNNPTIAAIGIIGGMGLGFVSIAAIFIIGSTFKEETDNKDYKIKNYDCLLKDDLESRMELLYDGVIHSKDNNKDFYSSYHKDEEVVVIAVMHVDSLFSEDWFVSFMNQIPELTENVINHTLIVIFIEEEKSSYLHEIMYAPEYNSLWDTKVFCVYDKANNKIKVNKTNSGTGDKAYNDVRRELKKIFIFPEKSQQQSKNVEQ